MKESDRLRADLALPLEVRRMLAIGRREGWSWPEIMATPLEVIDIAGHWMEYDLAE